MPPKKTSAPKKDGLFRDQEKENKGAAKKKKIFGKQLAGIVSAIRKNPQCLQTPEYKPLRDFITEAQWNPGRYSLSLPSEVASLSIGVVVPQLELTIGLGQKLRDRQPLISNAAAATTGTATTGTADTDPDSPSINFPVVQVTHISKGSLTFRDTAVEKYKLSVVDGDGHSILLHMDTSLNLSTKVLVRKGSILKLINFIPIYYNYDDRTSTDVLLLVKHFQPIAIRPIPQGFGLRPDPKSQVAVDAENPRISQEFSQALPSSIGNIGNEAPQDDSNDATIKCPICDIPITHCVLNSTCTRESCSKYNMVFGQCITKRIPVETVVLQQICTENPFVTMSLEEMDQRNKRFLLYYWYATNIYSIGGRRYRQPMPMCLMSAIWHLFANPNGEPYRGFEYA